VTWCGAPGPSDFKLSQATQLSCGATSPRPHCPWPGHSWSCRAHLATQPRHRRSAAWPSRGLDPAPPCPCRAAVPRLLRPAAELPPRDVPHLSGAFDCSVLQLWLLCPSGCIHVRPLPSSGVSVSAAPPHGFDRAVRVRPPRRIGPSAATWKMSRNSLGPAAASPHNSPKLAAVATNRPAPAVAPLRPASDSSSESAQHFGPLPIQVPNRPRTDSGPPPRHVPVALPLSPHPPRRLTASARLVPRSIPTA
jgi:hypothetical protein